MQHRAEVTYIEGIIIDDEKIVHVRPARIEGNSTRRSLGQSKSPVNNYSPLRKCYGLSQPTGSSYLGSNPASIHRAI
jgi:hypothetical protein